MGALNVPFLTWSSAAKPRYRVPGISAVGAGRISRSAERRTATAGAGRTRVGHMEPVALQTIGVVEGRALEQLGAGRIDDDLHATELAHHVVGSDFRIEEHLVAIPRTTAGTHRHPEGQALGVLLGQKLADLGRGLIGPRHRTRLPSGAYTFHDRAHPPSSCGSNSYRATTDTTPEVTVEDSVPAPAPYWYTPARRVAEGAPPVQFGRDDQRGCLRFLNPGLRGTGARRAAWRGRPRTGGRHRRTGHGDRHPAPRGRRGGGRRGPDHRRVPPPEPDPE